MATREEALAAIDAANDKMREAVRAADEARRLSAEAGVLTAADIISEGIQEVSADVFAKLPKVQGYTGTQTSQADVDAVEKAREDVISAATAVGSMLGILTKVAVKIAMT